MKKTALITVVKNDNKNLNINDIDNINYSNLHYQDMIVMQYEIDYYDGKELNKLYQEARQVWDNYYIVLDTLSFIMCDSHTYKDQILKELSN